MSHHILSAFETTLLRVQNNNYVSSIIDKHQYMHFFTFKTVLV